MALLSVELLFDFVTPFQWFCLNNILFEFKNMSCTYIYIQDILGSERKPMAYVIHFRCLDYDTLWKFI